VRAHPNVSLRVGYRKEFGTTNDPATGLSYGLGLHFHQLELDYALTPSNQFDDVHRLSFGYSFGAGSEERKPETPKPPKQAPPPPAPPAPRVIASANPSTTVPAPAVTPRKPVAAAPPTPAVQAPSIATPAPTPEPAPAPVKAPKARAPEYDVVLPGYASESSAQAELKALELLGFRVKDAIIEKLPESGYRVRLAHVRSKSSADNMAAALARMSFRAVVEVVQK
jgi:hypothetical protein